jgi:hypothetical protein
MDNWYNGGGQNQEEGVGGEKCWVRSCQRLYYSPLEESTISAGTHWQAAYLNILLKYP